MNFLWGLLWVFLYAFSLLPFCVLHRISDVFYFLIYHVFGYRRKIVRGNLTRSFPEKPLQEITKIEKEFYQGFCDLIFETIKTITLSKEEMLKRCVLTTPGFMDKLYDQNVNIMGAAAHLGNWEWMNLCLAVNAKQQIYGIIKPLSNKFFNDTMTQNRCRYGTILLPTKNRNLLYEELTRSPYGIGVFADQAPHFYPKAFVVNFLNQKTYVVPGPGLMVVEKGMFPVWGWIKRVGRSRYEWGLDYLNTTPPEGGFTEEDQKQIEHIASQYKLTLAQAATALSVTQDFYKKLEVKIKMAPQDWLWSHRRWKNRD